MPDFQRLTKLIVKHALELSAEEIKEVIEALELCAPSSELLAAFRQFRKEEFA